MTASSELRAAATKLRTAAVAARPGPWLVTEQQDPTGMVGDFAVVYVPHESIPDAATVLFEADWGELADAEWIALANPVIAEPLATALDLLADRWDTHDPVLDAMHQHDETAVGHHLLVIARQINEGGS